MGFLSGLSSKFSKTGRRLERKERSYKKAQAKAQIADIDSQLAFRKTEDPREQSMLRQSMFGRGLGKSTVHSQGMERLKGMQARQKAALLRNRDLANRGLSLIKLRARAARRMMPLDVLEDLGQAALAVGTGGASLGIWGASQAMPSGLGDQNFLD